jgi:hypothetical protein
MKLKEFMAAMPAWRDREREKIANLVAILTPISVDAIMRLQAKWDGTRPYEEFVRAQNAEIEKCVQMEKSMLGLEARKLCGLKPMTDETEVPDNPYKGISAPGPGKYDGALTKAREELRCIGAVLIVFGGEKGDGFSVQVPEFLLHKLPGLLRFMAGEIEKQRHQPMSPEGIN